MSIWNSLDSKINVLPLGFICSSRPDHMHSTLYIAMCHIIMVKSFQDLSQKAGKEPGNLED